MARALVFLWKFDTSKWQNLEHELEFARIPMQGELVALGNDREGVAADYEVALVHHLPRHDKIAAELYMVRTYNVKRIIGAKPASMPEGVPWKADSWPDFSEPSVFDAELDDRN